MLDELQSFELRLSNLIEKFKLKYNISHISDFKENDDLFEHFKNLTTINMIINSVSSIDNKNEQQEYFTHIKDDISSLLSKYETFIKN